jgi:hypothetical protein
VDFKLGDLNSSGTGVEEVCISLELFVINYSNKHIKEDTSPNLIVLFLLLLKYSSFSKKVYKFLK